VADAAVAGLFVYPIKGCRGLSLRSSEIGERGLGHDREWMVVDGDGRFFSQRSLPRLALVATALLPEALELQAPGMKTLVVPFGREEASIDVSVWRDALPALDQGPEAADWFSEFLQTGARLVRFDRRVKRYCNREFAGDSGAHTAFADAYPVLLLSEATLADLNSRLEQSLPINRFRPNILLSGVEAFDEDHLVEVRIGDVVLQPVKPCTRCEVTTIDQSTAEKGVEPLPTLSSYRMNERLGGVTFGMNAIVVSGVGARIDVGSTARCAFDF